MNIDMLKRKIKKNCWIYDEMSNMNLNGQFVVDILGTTQYALHKLYLENNQWLEAFAVFR